jgi:DNA-binding NarL/FixJ family response regulator
VSAWFSDPLENTLEKRVRHAHSNREALPCNAGLQFPIRVLVSNRSEIESGLLADAIGKDRRFVTVGWSVQHADIDSLALNGHPDVLLVTPQLDDKPNAGFDVVSEFHLSHPAVKIVVLLECHETEKVVQSFRLGARGVFSKDLPLKALTKCITRVHEGQIWATSEQFGFVMEALALAPGLRPHKISSETLHLPKFRKVIKTRGWQSLSVCKLRK